MIDKLNEHYSMTANPSVYDEEALTALELVARTTGKVNECVDAVNQIPQNITDEVQEQIENGTFDKQVDRYAGQLKKQISDSEAELSQEIADSETRQAAKQTAYEQRISADIAALDARMDTFTNLPNGSTTGDAELQDIRTWWNGNTSNTAGEAVRGQLTELRREAYQATANFGYVSWHKPIDFTIEFYRNNEHQLKVDFYDTIGIRYRGGNYEVTFTAEECADLSSNIEIASTSRATIYIPIYKVLVYSSVDKQLHFRDPASNLQSGDIALIKTAYAYPVGGTLFDEWCLQQIKKQNSRLNALENTENLFAGDARTQHYGAVFNGTGSVEKFLFFTDPHLCEGSEWESGFFSYMSELKKYHDAASFDFVLCGGDWLGNSDTQAQACSKLSFIDGQMRKLFPRYYLVNGNHDTNYQGVDSSGAANTGTLTRETVRNLWFNEHGKNYYKFNGSNTTFFVFDTDLDWDAYNGVMIPYYTEQFEWFMEEVEKCTGNIALVFHIARVTNTEARLHPLLVNVTNYASGYNARHADAKIRFALCGHLHEDEVQTVNGIPVITTTNLRAGGTATFDMCIADYTTNMLHMVRVGTGESRTVNI